MVPRSGYRPMPEARRPGGGGDPPAEQERPEEQGDPCSRKQPPRPLRSQADPAGEGLGRAGGGTPGRGSIAEGCGSRQGRRSEGGRRRWHLRGGGSLYRSGARSALSWGRNWESQGGRRGGDQGGRGRGGGGPGRGGARGRGRG